LAAGVAHEINNPLSIISGYAEYSIAALQKLQQQKTEGATSKVPESDVIQSLQVICDEAFRCKEITLKLLSLARGGDDGRKPVSLLRTAREVALIVGGLKEHRQKRLLVRAESSADSTDGDLVVSAVEPEMKQIVLNLAVNALEAVPTDTGEVRIDVRRAHDWIELAISDNGRGMSPATLERVFEPFFTEKRGRAEDGRHGTGLGLSITHAIVRNHGGTITAASDGLGHGSRFVVRLPAAVAAFA
jgi:signal transduction histidine kinase